MSNDAEKPLLPAPQGEEIEPTEEHRRRFAWARANSLAWDDPSLGPLPEIAQGEDLRAENGWQDIASAPRGGNKRVIVLLDGSPAEAKHNDRDGWWVATFNGQVWTHREPTHWRPLPDPPARAVLHPLEGEREGIEEFSLSRSQPSGARPADDAGPQSQHSDGEGR